MSLTRDGNDEAFEEIVRRHSPRVFRIASRFFRQRALVEDAAQESFLKAYTQLSNYAGSGSFEGWLTRLTTNQCLNMLRTAKRRPESTVSDLTETEGEWLDRRQAGISTEHHQARERGFIAADLAEKVLTDMSPDDRLVLMSIDGEDMSIKDVARMTGWSESKTKVLAFRARRRMRKAVEELLGLNRRREDQERAG